MVRGNLILGAALSALALALTGTAGCASTSVTPPKWATTPDAQVMADAYPGFAADAGIEGSATLKCRVLEGRLETCRVMAETPAGLGFGTAALSMSDHFRVEAGPDGRFAKTASFSVAFALPPVESPKPWQGAPPSTEAMALARTVAARMGLSLTQGAGAVRLEGLAPDRRAAVQEMIGTVETETGAEMREAFALHLARTQSLNALRMLSVGQRRPARPALSDDEIERSRDRVVAAANLQNGRLKTAYCARYRC